MPQIILQHANYPVHGQTTIRFTSIIQLSNTVELQLSGKLDFPHKMVIFEAQRLRNVILLKKNND